MAEVTKEDVNAIHRRIDDLVTLDTALQVSIGRMEQRLQDLKIPQQPCQFIKKHLNNHKDTANLWQKPLVKTLIDLVKMGIVAAVTYLFVRSRN